jgi:hypothetical protein
VIDVPAGDQEDRRVLEAQRAPITIPHDLEAPDQIRLALRRPRIRIH